MSITSSLSSTSSIVTITKAELTDLCSFVSLWQSADLKITMNWTNIDKISITVKWSSDTVDPVTAAIIVDRCITSYQGYFAP